MLSLRFALSITLAVAASSQQLKGNVQAVYDLLDRVLPGAKSHFDLSIVDSCPSQPAIAQTQPCYEMEDTSDGRLKIQATSASELSSSIGFYLRNHCNMTIGWPRGGNSNVFLPKKWPQIGAHTFKARSQPWSYFMNVCTHSYSLVWYSWQDWQVLIDWFALSGINLVLAMTGQEEVQYKVFRKFGLSDMQIRSWFNGPALLTWSRGQNEYGSDIAGPLPRSWMKDQWTLQRQILARYRSLGIVGQLPGFQGNVPIGLKAILKDANMSDNKKGTAWMDSLDPLFGKIADEWMKTMIEDFGTDHWYQLDGYFDGGTAPWMEASLAVDEPVADNSLPDSSQGCMFSTELKGKYIAGCSLGCKNYQNLPDAQEACKAEMSCGGVTRSGSSGSYELRSGSSAATSPSQESSWLITNAGTSDCHPPQPIIADPTWIRRGAAAYAGLNRTDPDAIWSFQGWAFVHWDSDKQGSHLKGFIEATPPGKFVVIDMSVNGKGEWQKWHNSSYWGAKFIWTTLHDFGGTDGMKGNLAQINEIPFAAMEGKEQTSVWGTGFTPEGIDQNPVYYEFIIDQNWRSARVPDITEHVILRSHRRYGLNERNENIAQAWALLVDSTYAQDLSVQDSTGIPHLPGHSSQFQADRRTPTARLCKTFQAWQKMVAAAGDTQSGVNPQLVTFRYDLVNLGRELLAQVATPASMNFSDAIEAKTLNSATIRATGESYIELLQDIDALVATDSAFLLGPWIEQARQWGANSSDCSGGSVGIQNCNHFYEWNARVQLTSWNPTVKGAKKVPGGPVDYASKHWSGLIKDYYAERAKLLMQRALLDASASRALDKAAAEEIKAELAYNFSTATNKYPLDVQGDALHVSQAMLQKYTHWYASCSADVERAAEILL